MKYESRFPFHVKLIVFEHLMTISCGLALKLLLDPSAKFIAMPEHVNDSCTEV